MAAYRNTWMFLIHKSETLECLQMGSYFYKYPQACVKHAETRQPLPDKETDWQLIETLECL